LDSIQGKIKWREEMLSWQDAVFHIEALLAKLKYEWIDDIPDNFIRTHGGQRITGSFDIDLTVNRILTYKDVSDLLESNMDLQNLFRENALSYLCNTAENIVEPEDIIRFDTALRQSRLLSGKVSRKIAVYLNLYHRLRHVFILRGLVYRLRSLLIKRGLFFKHKRITDKAFNQLKQMATKYEGFSI
jgi:hypothetical protein